MKLLSPDTGWVAYGKKLYWTSSGGITWRDITPIPHEGAQRGTAFSNVFFRDLTEGWAIVSYAEQTTGVNPGALAEPETAYSVAHTLNSGTTWSFKRLSYPELPGWIEDTFAGPASLYFLDSRHGWLNVAFAGNSKPGKLLATEDGGQTWTWVNSPGFSGPITFNSVRDGWLAGYFGGEKLYATHDGCQTWQEVKLSTPEQVGAANEPTFQSTPVFLDARKGYLVVHYSGSPGTPSKLAIYSTADGGKTWRFTKAITEAHEATRSAIFPFAVVDSRIIFSTGSSAAAPAVTSVPLAENGAEVTAVSYRAITALTFADTTHGWALTPEGALLATGDGGVTWRDIRPERGSSRPGRMVPIVEQLGAKTIVGGVLPSRPEAVTAAGSGNTHISKHLGFDISRVRPVAEMATWWGYSPYYDTSVYLPGALNRRTDASLNSAWITQVSAQGWG